MQIMLPLIAPRQADAEASLLRGLTVLRPGAEVVARVVSAPGSGGPGVLSLAGMLVKAHLPGGLATGARLQLVVTKAEAEQLQLRVLRDEPPAANERAAFARLAGELAASGDGELLRAGLALADGGAVPLPHGGAATFRVERRAEDEDGGGRDPEAQGEASFVLHAPHLGPIEVRVRLAAGTVRADVRVEPATAALARERAGELESALATATGRAALVGVAERRNEQLRPEPPRSLETLDVRA